jgi:hypothetical protein
LGADGGGWGVVGEGAESLLELERIDEALGGGEGEERVEKGLNAGVSGEHGVCEGAGLGEVVALDLGEGVAAESSLSGEELIEDGAEGVEVAADVDPVTEDAFRAHVERSAGTRGCGE